MPISTDDVTWAVRGSSPSIPSSAVLLYKPENYVAPLGVESVARFLWSQSRVQPLSHHRLDRLNAVGDVWVADSEAAGKREEFNMVILTLPVPSSQVTTPFPPPTPHILY